MGNDYRTVPTCELVERWERLRDGLVSTPPDGRTVEDCDALYEMRRELDRRRDEPKRIVDVNFAKDYLTD